MRLSHHNSTASGRRWQIVRSGEGARMDWLAVEEPLEIRVSHVVDGARQTRPISITMRTPGQDLELATGFLFTEGIVRGPDSLVEVRHCGEEPGEPTNTVLAELADDVELDLGRLERHFYTSSSCGVCGKTSLEAVAAVGLPTLPHDGPALGHLELGELPDRLRAAQPLFADTGGLHAAGWFDLAGEPVVVREDVGRHNAMDKVLGAMLLGGRTDLSEGVMVVSGRSSFELVQKALMARVSTMVAVGAPSSLAVELAEAHGMTLVGFTRRERFNVYTGGWRLR